MFCLSQFSGWCSGQPLVLARGWHGRPECGLYTFPWGGSLRFVPSIIDVGDWSATGRATSQDRALHDLWGPGTSESPSPWGIAGEQRHPATRRGCESLLCWKRGQKECFVLDYWMCLEFAASIKCVELPHHMWLHLLVMLNLRKPHPEECSLQCLQHGAYNTDSDFKGFGFLAHFSESFCYLSWKLIAYSKIHVVYCYNLIGFACENRCEKALK